eukprot:scaffold244058_cov31-Tisochrysis_lutea.AAC.1
MEWAERDASRLAPRAPPTLHTLDSPLRTQDFGRVRCRIAWDGVDVSHQMSILFCYWGGLDELD